MRMLSRSLASLAILGALALPVSAAEPIGYVKTVSGTAAAVRDAGSSPLMVGSPIYENDTLKTGPESSLGVTMKDGTTISAGPDTELLLDEYAFAPKKGEMGFIARVSAGTIDFVSGMLGKLAPETVSVETPTGVIGLRGTHFVVRVEPGQEFPEKRAEKS